MTQTATDSPDKRVESCLGPDLLWRDLRSNRTNIPRGALFIDRDGVLIEEKIYLHDPAEVELIPGVVELLRKCSSLNIPLVEVTNQAGIARGIFGWPEFNLVEARVESLLAAEGIRLDAAFACPFHEEGQGVYRVPDHPWRKPNAGMLFEAARLLNLDLSRSLLIGDKVSDIAAARTAGLPVAVQVLSGHGPENVVGSMALGSPSFRVLISRDLSEIVPLLNKAG